MIVHVLVEGASERVFVERWAPRAFPGHTFRTHPHGGKGSLPTASAVPSSRATGLLDLLPATLRSYAATKAMADDGFLVLVDADEDSCVELRERLVAMADALDPRPARLVFRIAIEETEAFYLGDLKALKAAFPSADLHRARDYVPDSICDTAELFGEIVGDGGLNKVWWAEEIGPHLSTDPARSRSPSFRKLHAGIATLVKGARAPRAKPKKHWKSTLSAKRRAKP